MHRSKPVTKKDLANSLGISITLIEQVDSKQLFVVRVGNYKELYSYYTKVGETGFTEDFKACWILTKTKYSPTTSKQLTQFANSMRRNGYDVRYSDEV